MITALSETERAHALADLPLWRFDPARNALYRRLQFRDFAEALGAMVQIGVMAEKTDHHPEWSNVYNTVEIWLTTHDANGVSTRDLALAQAIDGCVRQGV